MLCCRGVLSLNTPATFITEGSSEWTCKRLGFRIGEVMKERSANLLSEETQCSYVWQTGL